MATHIKTPYGLRVLRQDGGGHFVKVQGRKQYLSFGGGPGPAVAVSKRGQAVSKHGMRLLNSRFSGATFTVHEVLDHDGYDEDGPESDLWDMYVHVTEGTPSAPAGYYLFHTENWFGGGEVVYDVAEEDYSAGPAKPYWWKEKEGRR